MAVLFREEGVNGFGFAHALEAGLTEEAVYKRGRSAASYNEPGSGTYLLGGGIRALRCPHWQQLIREATKSVVAVVQTLDRCCPPPQFVESLILRLRITVVSPYYSILLYILCRVATYGSIREGVTNNKENQDK